ncbi:hypothetical protein EPN90_04555 [Patescibacteria group bacterium]|nr:MAG: hypothetical protein EPN90_04555 [Patescibacteria group bacterium]
MRNPRPLYRAVLNDALISTWRNKHLWPLAFFAGLLMTGSAYDLLYRAWNAISNTMLRAEFGLWIPDVFPRAWEVIKKGPVNWQTLPWGLLLVGLLTLALYAFFVWLAVVSEGTVLAAIAAEEEKERPNLRGFWQRGIRSFWPLLGVNILLRLAVWFLTLLLAAVVIPATALAAPLDSAVVILAFVLIIPPAYAAIVAAFFAALGVVRFKERLLPAVKKSWRLITVNWLVVLETSIILLLADILIALTLTILAMLLGATFFGFLALSGFAAASPLYWFLIVSFSFIVIVGVLAAVAGAITFHYAVWTILAERLRRGQQTIPKIIRLTQTLRAALSRR